MLKRDFERFRETETRTSESPLGSAALAGSSYPIDRHAVADSLGLHGVIPNSMDAVSDRDFAVEFVFNCSLMMMHLSRMAEEFILWASQEFGFCSLPDAYCSGSSIMPQKKNPDACELVRGKTGRVYGDLMGMLTTLKALPLTYNKDLQEDKEPVFDAGDTVIGCLKIMNGVVRGTIFKPDPMLRAASDPSLAATDLADRAAKSGMPFREAHEMIGAKIRQAVQGIAGEDLPSPEDLVEARNHIGGTSRDSVIQQISILRSFVHKQKVG
jgi:argininosuccinate lyase